jgi:hypothetical protein
VSILPISRSSFGSVVCAPEDGHVEEAVCFHTGRVSLPYNTENGVPPITFLSQPSPDCGIR